MAGDELEEEWQPEEIPDADRMFYRVHVTLLSKGEIVPSVFREQNGAMSTDWIKYSTPGESLNRAKDPSKNGIVELNVGAVRLLGMPVEHAPDIPRRNRAHTHVLGLSDPVLKTAYRARLLKLVSGWVIAPAA